MDKHPADTKSAHHGAHAHAAQADDLADRSKARDSGHSPVDFLSSVKALKEAEKSSAAIVENARKEAAKIEAQAREKAVEIAARASEKAVQAKDEILAQGREKTEKEVSELTHGAKKQAEKIRAKRLGDKDVSELSEGVI